MRRTDYIEGFTDAVDWITDAFRQSAARLGGTSARALLLSDLAAVVQQHYTDHTKKELANADTTTTSSTPAHRQHDDELLPKLSSKVSSRIPLGPPTKGSEH